MTGTTPGGPERPAAETSKFDTLAADYAAVRPGYPDALLDAIEDLAGVRLAGAAVADVGAGTGIASRQLRDRGARVTAVDLSRPMLDGLRADSPDIAVVQATGNALPFRDGGQDLVTFATAWHWVDPDRAVPEVRRVLRPGGALACFWNVPDAETGARRGYRARMEAELGGPPRLGTMSGRADTDRKFDDGPFVALGSYEGLPVRSAEVRWSRWITVAERLANIRSRSYTAGWAPARLAAFLDRERLVLEAGARGDGRVEEAYTAWLGVIRF